MKKIWLPFMLCVQCCFGQKKLKQELKAYLSQLPATAIVGLQVEAVEGSVYFSQNAETKIPAASIIKIPILVELMEQVKVGKIDLKANHKLTQDDKAGGSGFIATLPDGLELTINELAKQMIIASDNTATNILIRKLGQASINARMQALKVPDLQLNRVMMDTMAVQRGVENYVSCQHINQLLRLIYTQKVATPALCSRMMVFLLDNQDPSTLPSLLPKNLEIAHKTGGLTYVRGDAGIVFTNKPFVISVLVQGTTTPDAERIIGELAKICFNNLQ